MATILRAGPPFTKTLADANGRMVAVALVVFFYKLYAFVGGLIGLLA